MVTVKELLEKKGHDYWHVRPDATVFEALQKMADKNVGALMIIDKGKLVGMFSERDYARKIILQGFSSKEAKVGDFMTRELTIVSPSSTIFECMALLSKHHIRHLPVVDFTEIQGVITIRDVLNAIIRDQSITIKDLENYILGGGYGKNTDKD
jgi:signal-transduction protein with cAMP-binding, CBS, and nucleotidyltransferase domain